MAQDLRTAAGDGFEAVKPLIAEWSDEELHALLAAVLGVTTDRRRAEAQGQFDLWRSGHALRKVAAR